MEELTLNNDDKYAIEIAENTIRRFLKYPNLGGLQIVGLGNALYALHRLPELTPGVYCEFGLVYRAGTEEFSEMRYIDFRITEDEFAIEKGGSVFQKGIGSDSYTQPGWFIGASGHTSRECELHILENEVSELLNLGAKIGAEEMSNIEYEE